MTWCEALDYMKTSDHKLYTSKHLFLHCFTLINFLCLFIPDYYPITSLNHKNK